MNVTVIEDRFSTNLLTKGMKLLTKVVLLV